ncbi:MAG: MarR family transcriptional regulator [Bacillota bacterium]|nr:MarR family transcriptional regulator [Bacillota bacterium]
MDEIFKDIVENLYTIPPLFRKKLVKLDLYQDGIDLAPSHFHILFTLEDFETLAVTELAKILMISKTNATPLIQKLIDKAFVERVSDDRDRRYIHLKLTDSGKEFLANHKRLVMLNLENKIVNFNDEELEKLALALKDLRNALNKIE